MVRKKIKKTSSILFVSDEWGKFLQNTLKY